MESIWNEKIEQVRFSSLNGDRRTDVLVIGGGIAGILCAYKLKNAGVDCLLLEAGEICEGITKNTTAKITLQHGLIYDKLIRKIGEEKAKLYLQTHQNALEEYRRICNTVSCDFETKDFYLYSKDSKEKIEKEIKALDRLSLAADFCDSVDLPFDIAGAMRIKNQAQFHPLKFLRAVVKDLNVYEHTKVLELMPGKARTNQGEILCKKIIVATHFPVLNKHGSYFLKMYQHRSYVLALSGAALPDGMYVDENKKGLSFRAYGKTLLIGGGAHRTGKKGGGWRELESFANQHYPDAKMIAMWATQDCMTLDGIPYIGRYSWRTPDLYVATGFNKWGMTSAMVSANILCDLITGRENEYAPVFSPSRSIVQPQLAINAFEAVYNLITPTAPRCPHLGCALKYNREEHTWDCPCHGSRFTKEGELIDNPATEDKRSLKNFKTS